MNLLPERNIMCMKIWLKFFFIHSFFGLRLARAEIGFYIIIRASGNHYRNKNQCAFIFPKYILNTNYGLALAYTNERSEVNVGRSGWRPDGFLVGNESIC